jgi:hypothetical protein
MIDISELLGCLLIPGLFVWGFSCLFRRVPMSVRLPLGAAVGIVAALAWMRWLGEAQAGGEAAVWSDVARGVWGRFVMPREARDWLAWLILPAGLVAMGERIWVRRRPFAVVWGVLIALSLWRILAGSVYLTQQWTVLETCLWLGGISTGGAVAAWMLGGRREDDVPRIWLANGLVTVVLMVGAVVTLMSGSQTFGMIVIAAGAACGHATLAGLVWRNSNREDESGGFWIFVLIAVLAVGLFYAELQWFNFALLILAAGVAGGVKYADSKTFVVLAILLSLGLTGIAGGLAAKTFSDQLQQEATDPYKSAYGD